MKRFLKKANRGILLGGFALILLVIYIVVDYSGFSNEKPKVKEAVENYIEKFYEKMSANDYEAISELVDDTWANETVVSSAYGYYDEKKDLSQFFESKAREEHEEKYGKCSYEIDKLTVSKAGPNVSKVEFVYEATVEFGASGEYLSPFEPYTSGWYNEEEEDTRYEYEITYEVEAYLIKEDGDWKLVQCNSWQVNFMRYEKEGE